MMPPSRDVSIIGFADLELGMFTDPALSSVHQSGKPDGRDGSRLLLERIAGKEGRAPQIVLPTELRVRNSVILPNDGDQTS